MRIFIVNGQGGAGKTTFEEMVAKKYNGMVGVTSMIAYVKQVAEKIGWTGQKEPKDRKMLCNLKNLLTEWDDSPFISTCLMINQMERDGVDLCFIDAREQKDIERLKEKYDCQSIIVMKEKIEHYGNPADDNVFNIPYNIAIVNYGTLEDLEKMAEIFIKKISNSSENFFLTPKDCNNKSQD